MLKHIMYGFAYGALLCLAGYVILVALGIL